MVFGSDCALSDLVIGGFCFIFGNKEDYFMVVK